MQRKKLQNPVPDHKEINLFAERIPYISEKFGIPQRKVKSFLTAYIKAGVQQILEGHSFRFFDHLEVKILKHPMGGKIALGYRFINGEREIVSNPRPGYEYEISWKSMFLQSATKKIIFADSIKKKLGKILRETSHDYICITNGNQ